MSRFGFLVAVACGAGLLQASAQLHFVTLGNWGAGNAAQRSTRDTLKRFSREAHVSFLVSPGSNFVKGGLASVEDKSWVKNFVDVYEGSDELNMPLMTVMGHMDWQGNHTAMALNSNMDASKPRQPELRVGPRWSFPNWWYTYTQHFQDGSGVSAMHAAGDASAGFVFVDTYILSEEFPHKDITEIHWSNLKSSLSAMKKVFDWTIVVGNKSLRSSGASKGDPKLRDSLGSLLREHQVDLYISGSDYNMEVIEDTTPLVYVNCGSSSSADHVPRWRVAGSVKYSAQLGFCHHIVGKDILTTQFIDAKTGNVIFSYEQKRQQRIRTTVGRFTAYSSVPKVKYVEIPSMEKKHPSESDWFIRIVGTLGLFSMLYLMLILGLALVKRAQKKSQE